MKNYVERGREIAYTNAGETTLASGSVVVIGNMLGILYNDVEAGATGQAALEGVFTVPKVSGAVIAAGEDVLWDSSAGKFDDNLAAIDTGDVAGAAIAMEAAGNGVTSIQVKLVPPAVNTPASALKLDAATAATTYQPKFVAAPAAANSTGTAGQVAVDADYIYVCTATDTWKRVAIATWP